MNLSKRTLLITLCLLTTGLLTVAAPMAANAEVIDRIVARINDQIVTYWDVKQAATPYMLENGMDPSALDNPKQRHAIYKKVLDDLVDRKLLLQEAKKLDLSVSDQQVDQWLAYTRQQQKMSEAQFRQMIQHYGMTYASYREMIRQNLLKLRLVKVKVGSQVKVTDDEVDQAYRDRYGDSAGKTKHIEVSHILIRPENNSPQAIAKARAKAEEALAKVKNGADFATVAKQYSQGPSADQGGYLGTFERGDLDPDFEKAAFQLKEGQISPVVRTKFGFHVIKVSKVTYSTDSNVEERKQKLRAELQQKAVERQLQAHLQNLRSHSFVEVNF